MLCGGETLLLFSLVVVKEEEERGCRRQGRTQMQRPWSLRLKVHQSSKHLFVVAVRPQQSRSNHLMTPIAKE